MSIHTDPIEIKRTAVPASLRISPDPAQRPGEPAPPEPVPTAPTVAAETPRSPVLRYGRRALTIGAAAAAIAAASYFGWTYWTVGRFQISTDDAYVQADNSTIAPKVSGYIAEVAVADNETLKSGKVVARIDDRDYRVALDQARANADQVRAALASRQTALEIQQSIIEGARATLAVDKASLTFADQEHRRYTDLAATGSGSAQNAQQASSRYAVATASEQRDTAALASAVKQIDVLKASITQAEATLGASLAAVRQAELNLSYTTIAAPVDGVVGNRTLRVGQYVQAGTQLMAIVPTAKAYIVANYKETQLTHVEPGQVVDIEVDTFPGVVIHGRVDSIAPASGQQFALLPPDNATGNFTKIVQRIPVKIVLDQASPLSGKLRPGMSVIPSIDTKAAASRLPLNAVR